MKILFLYLCLLPSLADAQLADTTQDPIRILKPSRLQSYKTYIIPAVFIGYGLVSLSNRSMLQLDWSTKVELSEHHPEFAAKADNYLQFAPLAGMYALDLMGLKGMNNVGDQTAMALVSTGITTLMVHGLKRGTHRLRPNGSSNNSFPSGHTATAFAAAEMLHQEFKEQSPWIGYAGYTIAAATGTLRMYNNRHWFSDVVAGAGFGILSTKLTYLIYPHLKRTLGLNEKKLQLEPRYHHGAVAISLKYKFTNLKLKLKYQ